MDKENGSCEGVECGSSPKCEGCPHATGKIEKERTSELNNIKKVIAVVSGKGGVGKTMVTALLAVLLRRKGYNIGVLDADITGPSVPRVFGLNKKAENDEYGIYPSGTHNDIKVMSINLLLDKDEEPVIWRGPVLAGVVKQFWSDVIWGDLDCLLIDMPPGTGDVPLTVFQSLPVDGIVIVTSPQELVTMIVKKAYNMAKKMDIPVIGIVENMSYVKCPDCGKRINVFGESKAEQVAKEMGLELLGRVPLDPNIAKLSDEGEIEKAVASELSEAADYIEKFLKL